MVTKREEILGAHISRSTKEAIHQYESLVGLNYGALPPDNQLQFTTQLSGALRQSGVFGGREEALTQAAWAAVQENNVDFLRALARLPSIPEERAREALRLFDENSTRFSSFVLGTFTSTQIIAAPEMNAWSPEHLLQFREYFFASYLDMELLRSLPHEEQKKAVESALEKFLEERNIRMSEEAKNAVVVMVLGEIRLADLETMERVRDAGTIGDLLSAASYLRVAEVNSIMASLEPSAAMLYSPIEQQLLMMETYLEALRNFGLEPGEEEEKLERELEEYREEREKLSSELEEARTKFARELSEMGDEGGLNFLAQALEGNANPGSAEWNEFWTKERVAAFRRAVRG